MASLFRQFLGPAVSLFASSRYEVDPVGACNALALGDIASSSPSIGFTKASVLNATYYDNATQVETLGICAPVAQIGEAGPVFRVQFVVNTSSVSAITGEAWLPTTNWNGRLLSLGNRGLGGCIDYDNLEYGSSLGFASVASNNGHDGNSGAAFANNSEVLADYTSRSIHVETLVAKELISAFYKRAAKRSYYMGCSSGGRQGIYAALHHPLDFDGILAGSPATNFNHLIGWGGMISRYLGAPYGNESASFIPPYLWDVIAAEVLRQCDGLDGVTDGIISEPDACEFRPEELLCERRNTKDCLTRTQVEALRKIYSPLYDQDGELLFPRFDPGAESSPFGKGLMFTGKVFRLTEDWMKNVLNYDPNYDFSQFGIADIARFQALNPGNVSTFDGDLSAFRTHGGKLLTYHGRADDINPSGNSKALYNLVSRTLGIRPSSMDEFHTLFLVPGMAHCDGGKGAVRFGQSKHSRISNTQQENTESAHRKEGGDLESASQKSLKTPSSPEPGLGGQQPTNALLALVDWVEKGRAPDIVIGVSEDGKATRAHCRYPMRSRWDGERWVCAR